MTYAPWTAALTAALVIAVPSYAQRGEQAGNQTDLASQGGQKGPKITDPKEAAAYEAFQAAKGDKKISAGTDFITKFPKSIAAQVVADQVVVLAYEKKDLTAFYSASDKALAIDPNDAGVLALTGWVIVRNFKDGQTSPTLQQAEDDDKRALDLLATLQKPATLTDQQFEQLKATVASEAHSGLGLVYAREQKAEDAAAQLEQVIQPDATDMFMLGAAYEMMGKHVEASSQFKKCGAIAGPLQTPCTQNAADTSKEGADAK